ncbi:MAG: hypothetical protein KAT68_00325 [Bacteroidales bacterium]|nr:hypothetical protein [Bacteroidales bacterium]
MKHRNTNIILILLILFFVSQTNSLYSQKCSKKKYCNKVDLGDYDYRGQSSFTQMTKGDTLNIRIVVYAKKSYRILACGDSKFGELNLRIIYPAKKINKKIKEIITKNIDNTTQQVQTDTIWDYQSYEINEVIFNKKNSEEKKYWETTSEKTRLLIIEVTVPNGKKNYIGCVNVLVGHK